MNRTDECDNLSPTPDAALMERVARSDRAALGEIVRRHQRRVFELAFRTTSDRALAEDIVQDSFLRVWRSAGRYQPTARFSTWLYRIVVNLCLDAFKKRRPGSLPAVDDRKGEGGDPADGASAAHRAERVRAAVDRLPERQRVALVLHRFEGLSLGDVSSATGWSKSSVESLLVRAYARLREELSDEAET
ncbi:MAG: sigma-70 family RNA polymerase sigma factor [Phycisphaerae bacterium]|nr:sigma-70 family RNA polymerase sigma factor [Phycisphaerae bacterium]